jgi:regulator of RNase E activity RraA
MIGPLPNFHLIVPKPGKPLMVRGVLVKQDDYVTTDRPETVFVAAERIAEVLHLVEKTGRRQSGTLEAVRNDFPISKVVHDKQFAAIHAN